MADLFEVESLTKEQESASRQTWRTPPDLWAKIAAIWHPQIDLAADSTNHLCEMWCGPDKANDYMRDGLTFPAHDYREICHTLYCNPGFSNIGPWCEHVRRETWAGFPLGIMMVLVSPSTAWWNEWAMKADEIIMLTPRVQFVPPPGVKPSSNSKDNCLLLYRHGPKLINPSPRFSTWAWKDNSNG